ncbi:hypothetical protein quinque_012832 [Culex quinquefasciatus]
MGERSAIPRVREAEDKLSWLERHVYFFGRWLLRSSDFIHVIHSAENDILLSKFGHLGVGVEIEMLYLVQAKHKNDPEDPCQQSFEALTKKLSQNLEPDSNVATERYKFHRCVQAHDQSMTDYIIQLEACSWTC